MVQFIRFTNNEFKKILLRKNYILFFLAVCFVSFTFFIIALLRSRFPMLNIFNNSNIQLKALSPFSTVIFPLFILMCSVDLFTNEISNGSIRICYISIGNKAKLYLIKIAAIFYGVAILTGLLYFLTLIISLIFYRTTITTYLITLATYLVSLLPILVLILICGFWAQLFENSVIAITCAILLYIVLNIISLSIPAFSIILPQIFLKLHLEIESVLLSKEPFVFIKGLIILTAHSIIFLSAGKYCFENREL